LGSADPCVPGEPGGTSGCPFPSFFADVGSAPCFLMRIGGLSPTGATVSGRLAGVSGDRILCLLLCSGVPRLATVGCKLDTAEAGQMLCRSKIKVVPRPSEFQVHGRYTRNFGGETCSRRSRPYGCRSVKPSAQPNGGYRVVLLGRLGSGSAAQERGAGGFGAQGQ
jgi:hypothetical protein